MMSHDFGLSLVLIAAALGAKAAKADPVDLTTYTINFTGTGLLPTAGSFTYDPDTATFSNFTVIWHGTTFDETASANAPIAFGTGCTGEASTGAYAFLLMTHALTGCSPTYFWRGSGIDPTTEEFLFRALITYPNGGLAGDDIVAYTQATNTLPFNASNGGWTVTPVAAAVPEPSYLLLLATAAALMGWGRKIRAR